MAPYIFLRQCHTETKNRYVATGSPVCTITVREWQWLASYTVHTIASTDGDSSLHALVTLGQFNLLV